MAQSLASSKPAALLAAVLLIAVAVPAAPHGKAALATGAVFPGTNGVMFGPDGSLWVASVFANSLFGLDPDTGQLVGLVGPESGVATPDDLAFGPDGSVYWTAIVSGEVGRRTPDGTVTTQMVAPGVNPITFSDDGRLFVALDFYGDGLYELDPDLEDPPRLIIETLGFLNGMDWGPDGFLYGPIWTLHQVVRVDVDSGELTVVADDFGLPGAVKFDSQGRLHALDTLRGEVVRVDTATGATEVVAQVPPGADNLAFDPSDRLFVSSYANGTIVEVLADGTNRTLAPGGMIVPMGVAAVPRADGESVWVADWFSVRELDGATGLERAQYVGFPATDFGGGATVAPDGDRLVISDVFDNVVLVLDPLTGAVVESYHDFVVPLNAVRFQGDLVVVELGMEAGAARVLRQSATGREVLADVTDGLYVPAGLAVSNGDLWVGDWATGVVWQLADDGQVLPTPVPVAMGLANPVGLAADPNGALYAVEMSTATLARVDLSTGRIARVASGLQVLQEALPGLPPTGLFPGVAVGPSGAVYVSGAMGRVLYRFAPEELFECSPGATTLCLNDGRFKVEVAWQDFQGHTGVGQAISMAGGDSGAFWFFDQANVELAVKVLDGQGVNGHFWVFYGALSNVEYTLTVRDTATGELMTYHNPSGQFGSVGDTSAFAGP